MCRHKVLSIDNISDDFKYESGEENSSSCRSFTSSADKRRYTYIYIYIICAFSNKVHDLLFRLPTWEEVDQKTKKKSCFGSFSSVAGSYNADDSYKADDSYNSVFMSDASTKIRYVFVRLFYNEILGVCRVDANVDKKSVDYWRRKSIFDSDSSDNGHEEILSCRPRVRTMFVIVCYTPISLIV